MSVAARSYFFAGKIFVGKFKIAQSLHTQSHPAYFFLRATEKSFWFLEKKFDEGVKWHLILAFTREGVFPADSKDWGVVFFGDSCKKI